MTRHLAWFLAAALWPAAAVAAMPASELEPSAVRACLLPAEAERGVPEYPFDLYKRSAGGRVKATATFVGGRNAVWVSIDAQEGDEGFASPVRSYLRKLSAPCLPEGETASLQFDFVFQPDDEKVRVGGPVDPKDAARQRTLACLTHLNREPTPDYPRGAQLSGLQGRVQVRLSFSSADGPPEVRVAHRASAEVLAQAVKTWAADLRLPCFEGPAPLAIRQLHVFVLDLDSYGFKPVVLTSLMRMVKDIQRQRIQWNTHEMGCPFRLKLQYLQPFERNAVREVGERDPRRQPLLDWLAQAEITGKDNLLDAIFADTADVTVPCARFNLNPKE